MTSAVWTAIPLERRIARHMDARGEPGLGEALLGLKGVVFGGRYCIESLYAVGGEGAVYLARDLTDPNVPVRVAKVALLPLNRPFQLDSNDIRKRRYVLRVEADYLEGHGKSPFLPQPCGVYEFQNPLLDRARGDAFAELEPVLVMEKLPGRDLDVWLARMHRTSVPQAVMRRTLNRVAVVLLQALVDLHERGFFYADLRPANLRMMGRPERRVRLLDAGSLVAIHDHSGRFPHVPAYLPPEAFERSREGEVLVPTSRIQAVMAGRTLYEVATGHIPRPGADIDIALLETSNVSGVVADVITSLCMGGYDHVLPALNYLARRAKRRVVGGNDPRRVSQKIPVKTLADVVNVPNRDEPVTPSPAPETRHDRPWWRVLLRKLFL